jgi:retron-type reverse transcriptase
LLANIYLHSFDLSVTRAGYRLVRFADDWVILCPDQDSAEKAYNQSVVSLAHIHLKVNSEKTHILSPTDPLEWLGEVIA